MRIAFEIGLTRISSGTNDARRVNNDLGNGDLIMSGKMEQQYFDEKKALAMEGVEHANQAAGEVMGLLSSWNYDVPNIVDPVAVHDQIRVAKAQLDNVRRNFEKLRWASAETDFEFNEWLEKHGHADLMVV
jgi:hypothetical protein